MQSCMNGLNNFSSLSQVKLLLLRHISLSSTVPNRKNSNPFRCTTLNNAVWKFFIDHQCSIFDSGWTVKLNAYLERSCALDRLGLQRSPPLSLYCRERRGTRAGVLQVVAQTAVSLPRDHILLSPAYLADFPALPGVTVWRRRPAKCLLKAPLLIMPNESRSMDYYSHPWNFFSLLL